MDFDPYQDLANAIVALAAKDYMKARKRQKRYPEDGRAAQTITEVRRFFHSEWYTMLTSMDPDRLLAILEKEVVA